MSEVTLHPTPRMRDVVREQIRLVALSVRPVALVLAVVFGTVTLLIAIEIVGGSAETWFDSGEWTPILLFSFLFPLAVWRADRRFGPAFLWTLPVDRRRLALARVFAGWVWLFTAVALVITWHVTLAAIAGARNPHTFPLIALPGATAMYLLGSAVVLGLRHPLRWLFGAFGLTFLLGGLSDALERTAGVNSLLGSRRLFDAVETTVPLWRTFPEIAQWAIVSLIGIAPALAALFAALARHRERRRY